MSFRFLAEPVTGQVSLAATTAGAVNFGAANRFRRALVSTDVDASLTWKFGAVGDAALTSLSATAAAGGSARFPAHTPIPIEQVGGGQYLNLYNLGASTVVVTVTAGKAD